MFANLLGKHPFHLVVCLSMAGGGVGGAALIAGVVCCTREEVEEEEAEERRRKRQKEEEEAARRKREEEERARGERILGIICQGRRTTTFFLSLRPSNIPSRQSIRKERRRHLR